MSSSALKRRPANRVARALVAGAVLLAGLAAGCGDDPGELPQAPDYEAALKGAPRPLANLYAGGGELRDGGAGAFEDQLERLRGYPVVVNKWASWCAPCRAEFPYFQREVAKRGTEIAFLGVNSTDDPDAAATFLEELPVPYPSYTDPSGELADRFFDGAREFPATAFYDSSGELAYVRRGGYDSREALAADIERYAD